MHKLLNFLVIFLTIAVGTWAQSQIATVSSATPFDLRGANVTPGQGVPSWPVLPGDTIKAGTSPVTVTFSDGSGFVMDPGSVAKIDLSGPTPVFQLESGLAHYFLKELASVKLLALDKQVVAKSLTGILRIGHNHVAAGWLAVGGAAAATGLGVGLAQATSGGSSVSPVQ